MAASSVSLSIIFQVLHLACSLFIDKQLRDRRLRKLAEFLNLGLLLDLLQQFRCSVVGTLRLSLVYIFLHKKDRLLWSCSCSSLNLANCILARVNYSANGRGRGFLHLHWLACYTASSMLRSVLRAIPFIAHMRILIHVSCGCSCRFAP